MGEAACLPTAFWESVGIGLMLFFGLIGWGIARYIIAHADAISREGR